MYLDLSKGEETETKTATQNQKVVKSHSTRCLIVYHHGRRSLYVQM